jgi:hypothetical protein
MNPNENNGAPAPEVETAAIPDNFKKVIVDFISSFITTFPEYKDGIYKVLDMQAYSDVEFININANATGTDDKGSRRRSTRPMDECINNMSETNVRILFEHCKRVYPERFFDILYQNDMIFSPDSAVSNDVCVDFLPNVDFRLVWNLSDISDTTKDHLWKHLQLITFTILGSISRDKLSFGDTARLFEAIDENELRAKLEETMSGIHSLFEAEAAAHDGDGDNTAGGAKEKQKHNQTESESDASSSFLPNADSIHEQLSGLLDGKIGALAKEIAEETVSELGIDVSNESSVTGVFQKLMKNPGKLSGIIKKVGDKLDKKMKSGDIKESELFKEASDFMSKMKSSGKGGKGGGGMADFAQIFKAMNLNPSDLGGAAAGLSGKTKINLNAMQAQMGRNMKMALTKERMQKKLEERRAATAAKTAEQLQHSVYQPANAPKNEKTMRVPMPAPSTDATPAAAAAASNSATDSKPTGYEPVDVDHSEGPKHKKHKKK